MMTMEECPSILSRALSERLRRLDGFTIPPTSLANKVVLPIRCCPAFLKSLERIAPKIGNGSIRRCAYDPLLS
jgi:hypothetical protein